MIEIPDNTSSVRVVFEAPLFDRQAQHEIRDAFELLVLDQAGQPLVFPFDGNRQASYNWSEDIEPAFGPGTQTTTMPAGSSSTATFNLAGLSAGTKVQVIARLVNNDSDVNTSVIVRRVEVVDNSIQAPAGIAVRSTAPGQRPVAQINLLTDVSSSISPVYGRTSLIDDQNVLVTELQVVNQGIATLSGELLVAIDQLSDSSIGVMHPDGFLSDGRPYFAFRASGGGDWLAPGKTTGIREIRFVNATDEQFTFSLTTLAALNSAPSAFTSIPLLAIEAGRTYGTTAVAFDPDGQPLSYSLVAGPEGMTINAATGQVQWITRLEDVGNHSVILAATDPFGLSLQQTFTISVHTSLPNRPPVITSTPMTEATVATTFEVQTFPTGKNPIGAVADDFGAGMSYVTANAGHANLTLRNGAHTSTLSLGESPPDGRLFRSGTNVDVGFPPIIYNFDYQEISGFAQADLNGDGNLDLVSVNFQNTQIQNALRERFLSVVLGRGDGTFEAAQKLPIRNTVNDGNEESLLVSNLIIRDFNADGKLDLLALSYDTRNANGQNQLLFWRGHGNGSFDPVEIQDPGVYVGRAQAADFNADGKLDLYVTLANWDRLGILLGKGDGTFGAYSEFANLPGSGYFNMDGVGDFDGVNGPDIAVPAYHRRQLDIFLNDGTGGFSQSTSLGVYEPYFNGDPSVSRQDPLGLWVGDFSGDGNTDVLYMARNAARGGGGLGLWRGTGDGVSFNYANAAQDFPSTPVNSLPDHGPLDLDGDGDLDVVFGHSQGQYGATVSLNNGDGTFTSTTYQNSTAEWAAGRNDAVEFGVLAGDYNRDGLVDISMVGTRQSTNGGQLKPGLTILWADTPGEFAAPRQTSPNTRGNQIINLLGDLDNDGILDLVLGDGGRFYSRLGNIDGSFQVPQIATPSFYANDPHDGFLADLNHDGILDLVWSRLQFYQGANQGYDAALGNGDGTFTHTFDHPAPNFYGTAINRSGDFNQDGYTDFVAAGGGAFASGPFLDVWLYDPSNPGTFLHSELIRLEREGGQGTLAVGDFNNDGHQDMLLSSPLGSQNEPRQLLYFQGRGDGTFEAPIGTPIFLTNSDIGQGNSSWAPHWADSGDLNHDGNLDYVMSSSYSRLAAFLGKGDGTFRPSTEYATGTFFASERQIYLRDLDADGHLDLVAIDDNQNRRVLAVRRGLGDGRLAAEERYVGTGMNYLDFGDVNNDGRLDAVASSSFAGYGHTLVFVGQGQKLSGLTSGDLNGDGRKDLLAINADNSHLKILLGVGPGAFERQYDVLVGRGVAAVGLLDFDKDGDPDIATANQAGRSVSVLNNNGLGVFTRVDVGVGALLTAMAIGELTGDTFSDILVASEETKSLYLLKNRAGVFEAPMPIPLGDVPGQIALADVNNDQLVDIVVSLPSSKRLMILPRNGDGSLGVPQYIDLAFAAGGLAAADFNLDGVQDLAITIPTEGQAAILFGRSTGIFARPQRIKVGANPTSLTITDVNVDGRPDILVANQDDDTASVIINRYDPTNIYRYTVTAIDPDGDAVSFDLQNGPGGMLLEDASGHVLWAPTADQIGLNPVTISASDGRGGSATQNFSIAVAPAQDNAPPAIFSQAPETLDASQAFRYMPTAIDPNGDTLRYRLLSGPVGATVDPTSGEVTWDPRGQAVRANTNLGTEGYVTVPYTATLSAPSITVEGFFNLDRTDRNQTFFRKMAHNPFPFGVDTLALEYFAPGVLRAAIAGTSGADYQSVAWTPNAGQWYHLALSFDDVSGAYRVFIDGTAVLSTVSNRHLLYDGNPLTIGLGHGNPLFGSAANFRIWDHARSADELRNGLIRQFAADQPGLLLDYRFDQGDAQTIHDHSQFANDGRRTANFGPWPTSAPGLASQQRQHFAIQVEDGKGGHSTQSFHVNVVPPITGEVSGKLFDDLNHDQTLSAGEPGLPNWLVFLDTNGNGTAEPDERQTRTAADGTYKLAGLLQGDQSLSVMTGAGYAPLSPQRIAISPAGTTQVDLPVNALALGKIAGNVSLDVNANGVGSDLLAVYTSSFSDDSPNLTPWSNQTIGISPNGEKFLGEFTNDTVTLTLDSLLPHEVIHVAFDLYVLKSWDGESGPDQWQFSLDNQTFVNATFGNTGAQQSYPQTIGKGSNASRTGAHANNTLGYSFFGDATYHFQFSIPHQGTSASLTFKGLGLQNASDESWALDNVVITATEPKLVGWPVFLDLNDNQFRESGEPETFTDSMGTYAFNGLANGNYVVRLDNPAGWTTTAPIGGQINVVLDGTSIGNNFGLVSSREAASRPRFTTVPHADAIARVPYRFANVAMDPSQRPLTYSLQAAPEGMAIDAATGTMVWTPTRSQLGPQRVILKVVNDHGGVTLQDIVIHVSPPNTAPRITSIAPQVAHANAAFQYDVFAQDAEQSILAFSLTTNPTGANIDRATGRITWMPDVSQVGVQFFAVQVSDLHGGLDVQDFALPVTAGGSNSPPTIAGSIRRQTPVGQPYVARIQAVDDDGDPLTFALLEGPLGMTLATDGTFAWTPDVLQFGSNHVRVSVNDGRGGLTTKDFEIDVRSSVGNQPPAITSQAPTFSLAEFPYHYQIVASDADSDLIAFDLVRGPSGLSLDPIRGSVVWLPAADQLGQHEVSLIATDPLGGVAQQAFTISVRAVGGPPAITSVPPTTAAVGSAYLYSVLASDSESDPLTFALLTAPQDMLLNATTGELVWTPTVGDVGRQSVVIQVSDGLGGFVTQAFAIEVASASPNQAPIISSNPSLFSAVGSAYNYALTASDPENSAIIYSVRRGPAGLTVDSTTGVVTWIPTSVDVGTTIVALVATDAGDAAAVQSFEISVLAANSPPVIRSTAPPQVTAGGLYRYDVLAADDNLDPLKFELLGGPAGMTADAFGRVRWRSTIADLGVHPVKLRVSDPRGGFVEQSFNLRVVADTTAPRVTVIPLNQIVRANSPSVFAQFNLTPVYPTNTVRISAVDDVAVTDLQVTANGKLVALDAFGNATFSFKDWGFGSITVVAKAYDAAGNQATGAKAFAFLPFGDDPSVTELANPVVVITSPTESGSVTGFVDVVGSASSDHFTEFTLSYRRGDSSDYKTIASGSSKIHDGILGKWDTTLLENDQYFLRLEVKDDIFGTTSYEQSVGVSGNFKLGNFQLSFEDMTIPVAGIPITIVRMYDTLRADRDSDFGFGWRLEYRNTDLRTSLPKSGLENLGIYTPFRDSTKVYLTLPGGERQGFTFTPEYKVLPGFGQGNNLTLAYPKFTSDRGVTDQLSAGGGSLFVNGSGEFYSAGGIPWNPASPDFSGYTLTTAGGLVYKIDGATGKLQSVRDRNGHALIFTEAGITSSTDEISVSIERDLKGRISSIIDPSGNPTRYAYSATGDLTQVVDRNGHSSQIIYRTDRAHILEKVIDPLGRTGIRAEYGADGRLTATFDALGNAIRTTYDPANQLVTLRDPSGTPTLVEYDRVGNVVATTDALGGVFRFTYDEFGNTISSTDPLGGVTRSDYDNQGQPIRILNALGEPTYFSYDTFGNITSTVNALGHTTTSTYDANGNTKRVVDSAGAAFEWEYAGGRLTSASVPGGATLDLKYGKSAFPIQSNDLNGQVSTISYDANGRSIARATQTNLPGGNALLTENTLYDAEGRILAVSDLRGVVLQNTYDAAGQLLTSANAHGIQTNYLYDANGRLIETRYADGSREQNFYDARGHLTRSVDGLGRETHYVYDVLGRQTAIVYPDGTPETQDDNPTFKVEYDALGRKVAEINEMGERTQFEYDLAGQLTIISDALGRTTAYSYDGAGNVVRIAGPLNNVVQNHFDAAGRPIGTTFADGSTTRRILDQRGNPLGVVDENGNLTRFEQDAAGHLTNVIDALGGITNYEYDNRGLLIRQVDALGNVTTFDHDLFGREIARTLPGAEVWESEYNELDQLIRTTDPNGKTILFSYDTRGRLISKSRSDGVHYQFTYSPTGNLLSVEDPRGTTRFGYDQRDRLLVRTEPNGQAIRYSYDLAGRMLSMATLAGETTYAYAADGQLHSIKEPGGATTNYVYDAAGQLVRTEFSNGVVENRGYDVRGRLIRKDFVVGLQTLSDLRYTLDPTGRVIEANVNGVSHVYDYDANYRLISETNVLGRITYSYDAVGNRLSRNSANEYSAYQYDANNRHIQVQSPLSTTGFVYDRAGNLLRKQSDADHFTTYAWDAENRLIQVDEVNGQSTTSEQYRYDSDGNRIATIAGASETRYLLDLNGQYSQVVAEYDGTGNLLASTLHGVGLIGEIRQGQASVFITDRLGSILAVTNEMGEIVARYNYDAYGQVIAADGVATSSRRFTGELRSSLSGLDYLRARYYDPTTGRFISADTFAGSISNPTSRHKYQYADLDPVNNRDPSGLQTLVEVLSTSAISETTKKSLQVRTFTKVREKLNALDYLALAVRIGYSLPMALAFGEVGGPLKASVNILSYSRPKGSKIAIEKFKIDLDNGGGKRTLKFGIDTALGKYDIQVGPKYPFLNGISLAGADSVLASLPSGSQTPFAKVSLAVRPLSFKVGVPSLHNFPAKMTIDIELPIFGNKYSFELLPFLLIAIIESNEGKS